MSPQAFWAHPTAGLLERASLARPCRRGDVRAEKVPEMLALGFPQVGYRKNDPTVSLIESHYPGPLSPSHELPPFQNSSGPARARPRNTFRRKCHCVRQRLVQLHEGAHPVAPGSMHGPSNDRDDDRPDHPERPPDWIRSTCEPKDRGPGQRHQQCQSVPALEDVAHPVEPWTRQVHDVGKVLCAELAGELKDGAAQWGALRVVDNVPRSAAARSAVPLVTTPDTLRLRRPCRGG